MASKIIVKSIYYALIAAVAFAAGALFHKTLSDKTSNVPTRTGTSVCVITIDGQKYDISTLRSEHPGGDIFECGMDMSAVFHDQHGDSLKMIEKYLIK